MLGEESDTALVLASSFLAHDDAVNEARREMYAMLVEEAWKIAMKSRHYLTTQCLDSPSVSAWMMLYRHGSDLNFLNATSLTRPAFHQLLCRFGRFFCVWNRQGPGRPPKLRYLHQILGLVLSFYTGSMEQPTLCLLFGVPPTTLSRTLSRAEEALFRALDGYAPARISWPSPARQVELAKLVEAREPLLKHTFGFIDRKNLKVQQPANGDMQNAMYNGWLHTVHNCPGSWNDSDTSLGFRTKLLDPSFCPDTRMNVVSDSAFPCSTAMAGRILTPLKDGDLERLLPSLRSSARTLHNAITSVRQAAEWGMGSMQKVYSHLNLPLPYDPKLRGMRINNIFRLCNYRVRTVGISQIRTMFSGEFEVPQ